MVSRTQNHHFASTFSDFPPRKIPWRLSAPQKLRHRRRMRRVDNIVSVLDTALKRQVASTASTSPQQISSSSDSPPSQSPTYGSASSSDLSTTAEGQRLLASQTPTSTTQPSLRPVRGSKAGDTLVPASEKSLQLGAQARAQGTIKLIERWKAEMPTEQEMLPRDKYTMFDRKQKGYRKGVHKLPKWTRVSQRLNPPGF